MILHTENTSDFKYYKNYQKFSSFFLDLIVNNLQSKAVEPNQDRLYRNVLYEFSKFEKININFKILREYIFNINNVYFFNFRIMKEYYLRF